jgi:hypothetical protein
LLQGELVGTIAFQTQRASTAPGKGARGEEAGDEVVVALAGGVAVVGGLGAAQAAHAVEEAVEGARELGTEGIADAAGVVYDRLVVVDAGFDVEGVPGGIGAQDADLTKPRMPVEPPPSPSPSPSPP